MQKCWVWLKVGQTIKHVVNMTFQIDNGGGERWHSTHIHQVSQRGVPVPNTYIELSF